MDIQASKRILILSMTFYPKPVGGAEVAIKELTDRLHEDYEFHLISLRLDSTVPREERFGNIHVHRIGFTKRGAGAADFRRFPLHLNKFFYQFLAVWHVWRLHRQHRFNILWGMMAHSTGVPCGIFKTIFPEVTYVLTLQEGDPPEKIEHTMRPFGPFFRRGFTKADIIQTISTFLANWAKEMGARTEPVVIPNGVNIRAFDTVSEEDIAAVRKSVGMRDGEAWLIHTGRLVPKNGLADVIAALTHLPEGVRALFIGDGPQKETLRILAASLGVSDRVVFVPHVDASELPKYLRACDIFVRPSRSEGQGISFIEAMAARIPVVATQVGGLSDFIFDRKRDPEKESTAWVVDPSDPEAIADTALRIMHDEEARTETVHNARMRVENEYDWDVLASRMREEVFARAADNEAV